MIGAIWSRVPWPNWVKALCALVLVAGVLWACHVWVFPWADDLLFPVENVTIPNTTPPPPTP